MEAQSITAMVAAARGGLKDKRKVSIRVSGNAMMLEIAAIEAKTQVVIAGGKSRTILLYVEAEHADGGRFLVAPEHLIAMQIT